MKRVTKRDYGHALSLAARYLWCERGEEGTVRLIEVLREGPGYVAGGLLAEGLQAVVDEQRELRRRGGVQEVEEAWAAGVCRGGVVR